MPLEKSKSNSSKMSTREAFKVLGLSREASLGEINEAFKRKLSDLERKYADKPDKMVSEGSYLYSAYSRAYLSKEGANEDNMLPFTVTGSDDLLNAFGIQDISHQSMKVQMQSQAHYKDGQLVKKESTKTESFINKDGKRETKVFSNGKLISHTIDEQNMLK